MQKPKRQLYPVLFTNVTIDDHFWSPRLKINRERSIPHIYNKLEETGRLAAYKLDWKPGMEYMPHQFWDSDVAKWVEAASYSLATHPDPTLEARVDGVIALVASAQQADGYLNPHYTVVEPQRRWKDLRNGHELYCAGHLIEAGVAHFQATEKRTLLNVMCRYADYIESVFGIEAGKKRGYCGHEEIELALVKLYHATGEQRYLQLSRYFIDERGRRPHYFDQEDSAAIGGKEYHQAHLPVREQSEVVGHAVRAMYLYSAMADLAAETGDESLFEACKRLWQHLCSKRMFITGGIGSSMYNEGFTSDYDLPNDTAYAETCAAIGLVLWS
ncbi:MAG TPA: beta-L-arabinofuranosidase domain-containing protein, partial [Ktedonobacteraceae bacterium]|nr:beta-L-arabinofuranosidase domain-containing protein [Ktedonobacteraceae bacterium]